MFSKRILGSSLIATLAITAPVFAQSQIDNNQPVQGSLHSREVEMQNKLKASYKAGIISSTELAEMQRDLDGILVKETRQRTKAGGITDSNFESISKALDTFESKIVGHTRSVAATSDVGPIVIPAGVPITPITGNQSSTVQPSSQTFMVPSTKLVPTITTVETAPGSSVTKTTTVRTEVTP